MKIILSAYFVLQTIFIGWSQTNTISFVHNGYEFQTDIKTIIDYLEIESDSIEFYEKKLITINSNVSNFNTDTIIQIGSQYLYFSEIIRIFERNHSFVKIIRITDNSLVIYKVKYKKIVYPSHGIGESSDTFLIINDKKKRKEIVRWVIKKSLAC